MQADRSRFLWSRRRRSSNCKLYINRKWPSRTSNEDHLEGRKLKKKRERETHTPIQNDTKQTFKDQTIRALCRSLFIIQHPPTLVPPICKRVGGGQARRKRDRENKRWFYGGYLGGSGLRTRGHSVGNAGKIESYTLFGSLLSCFGNVVSLPGV